jgi:hypothetical protein
MFMMNGASDSYCSMETVNPHENRRAPGLPAGRRPHRAPPWVDK